jgi:hypothetical protein
MSGHAQGGNDTFTAEQETFLGTFYGDAGGNMSDYSKGGNDTFTAANIKFLATNTFYGDAGGNMSGHSEGGNDSFTTRTPPGVAIVLPSIFYGDAGGDMSDFARGGDDLAVLSGLVGTIDDHTVNEATGDALTMSGHAVGGDDKLTGGDAGGGAQINNHLWGDATVMSGSAHGGNDVLTGGNNILIRRCLILVRLHPGRQRYSGRWDRGTRPHGQ